MFDRNRLIKNTTLLTGSALAMRFIAMAFQVWIVGRIGAAGVGLFQLVMTVGGLSITLAISGSRFACTRLIAEEIGLGRPGSIGAAMRRCMGYSLFFGIGAAICLFVFSEPIGFLWIGDARTVLPLRLFAISLPCISITSVIAGYFTANARVYKNALVQISEQLVRMALVAALLSLAPEGDLEITCACVVAGGVLAEFFSLLLFSILYIFDRRIHGEKGEASKNLTLKMLAVALPLAFSAYARSSLATLEQLLVPRGLKASGMSADRALAAYGTIQGMVFPIISFPSSLMLSLSELLVPELTQSQAAGRFREISRISGSLLKKCLAFSLFVSAFMFIFAELLGTAIYHSSDAGLYIRIFSLLAPVMYMDMVTDGMLKGLGQMIPSMFYNIMDAAISVVLVYTLLPVLGIKGYIIVVFFTECFNYTLSTRRLFKVAKPEFNTFS